MKTRRTLGAALLTAGLIMSSASVVSADETATPKATKSTSASSADLLAYKTGLLKFRIALTVNSINYRIAMEKYWADWQATLDKYLAPYKAALEQYRVLEAAYLAKLTPIITARRAAMNKADSEFLAAVASATTDAQMELALKNHATATSAANEAFQSAKAALGAAPVKPVKPAELTKPPLPVKPSNPVKPLAPTKPDNGKNKKTK
ncbi:MAG TPA: hypothetical protein VMW30_03050 [Candidatus Paceibacterota bacterium]|nr:hypothetical protein [Candidatus Paceibacterota bacterium]